MTAIVKTSNKGVLNLRAKASTTGQLLAQIAYGTKLEVTKVDSNWYKTTFNGKEGYVMGQHLEIITSESTFNKMDLQNIYNSLKETLTLIEKILQ